MILKYTKTNWVNNVTPLNAKNMNNIENGIEALATELENKQDKLPFASSEQAGIVQVKNQYGIDVNSDNGLIFLYPTNDTEISARSTTNRRAICISNLDYAVKAAMCDGKGAAWTDTEKAAARSRMGAAPCMYRHSINILGDNFEFSFLYLSSSNEQFNTPDKLIDNVSPCNTDTELPMIYGSGFYGEEGVNTISTRPGQYSIRLMYFDQGLSFNYHEIINHPINFTITDTVVEI